MAKKLRKGYDACTDIPQSKDDVFNIDLVERIDGNVYSYLRHVGFMPKYGISPSHAAAMVIKSAASRMYYEGKMYDLEDIIFGDVCRFKTGIPKPRKSSKTLLHDIERPRKDENKEYYPLIKLGNTMKRIIMSYNPDHGIPSTRLKCITMPEDISKANDGTKLILEGTMTFEEYERLADAGEYDAYIYEIYVLTSLFLQFAVCESMYFTRHSNTFCIYCEDVLKICTTKNIDTGKYSLSLDLNNDNLMDIYNSIKESLIEEDRRYRDIAMSM